MFAQSGQDEHMTAYIIPNYISCLADLYLISPRSFLRHKQYGSVIGVPSPWRLALRSDSYAHMLIIYTVFGSYAVPRLLQAADARNAL